MKRFTPIEVAGVILGGVLFIGGLTCVIWPRAAVIIHPTNDWIGRPGSSVESVSTTGARMYGVLAMLLGVGIAALAVYRRKN